MRVPLSHAAEVTLGRQRAPQYEDGEGQTPYLRSANIADGVLNLSDVKRMRFSPVERVHYGLRPGDVLVTEGSGSRDTVGASAVWNDEIDAPVCFQNTLLRLRPRRGVDGRYLAWWARHAHTAGLVAAAASGANILHIGAESMRTLPIHIPRVDEQRRIADFLDDQVGSIERAGAQQRAQVRALNAHAISHLDAVYSSLGQRCGLIPLRRWIRRIEQGWSPQCDASPAEEGEYGILKLSAVKDGRFIPSENKALPASIEPQRRYSLRRGDLLMSRANTPDLVGDVAVVPQDHPTLGLCDLLYRIDLAVEQSSFVAAMLRSPQVRTLLRVTGRGTSQSMAKIRGDDIAALPVPNADRSTRLAVAQQVSDLDQASRLTREAYLRLERLLTERKTALITACVTGEFDVTTAGNRASAAALSGASR